MTSAKDDPIPTQVRLALNRKSPGERPGEWVMRGLVYVIAVGFLLCAAAAFAAANLIVGALLMFASVGLALAGKHAHIGEASGMMDLSERGWVEITDRCTLAKPVELSKASISWVAVTHGSLLSSNVLEVCPNVDLGTWDMELSEAVELTSSRSVADWIPLGDHPGAANAIIYFSVPQSVKLRRDKLGIPFYVSRNQQVDLMIARLDNPLTAIASLARSGIDVREVRGAKNSLNWNSVAYGFSNQIDRWSDRSTREFGATP